MRVHWEALDQVVDDLDEATVKQDKYKYLKLSSSQLNMVYPLYKDLNDIRLDEFQASKELFNPVDFFNEFNEKYSALW
jgi:hypothetical protein